ncbi:hypothetical protein TB2_040230 [Malus domestica]
MQHGNTTTRRPTSHYVFSSLNSPFDPRTRPEMERSTPVRKPYTFTADLLTWSETPLAFISSQCGRHSLPHQPRHQCHLRHLPQIEERILGYRDESQRLDQCSRLYDSSVSNDAFDHDASRILQELRGISTSIDRQHKHLRNQKTLRKTDEQLRSILQGSKAEIAPTAAAARPPGGVGVS